MIAEARFNHVTDDRFRHGAKLVCWRPDEEPSNSIKTNRANWRRGLAPLRDKVNLRAQLDARLEKAFIAFFDEVSRLFGFDPLLPPKVFANPRRPVDASRNEAGDAPGLSNCRDRRRFSVKPEVIWGMSVKTGPVTGGRSKPEPKMNAETVLRKLHFHKALSDDELKVYLNKVRSDGSLPPSEIPILLELMRHRTENLPFACIKELSILAGGNRHSAEKAGIIDEEQAMRAIASKLTK